MEGALNLGVLLVDIFNGGGPEPGYVIGGHIQWRGPWTWVCYWWTYLMEGALNLGVLLVGIFNGGGPEPGCVIGGHI